MLKILPLFVLLTVSPHLTFAGIYRCEDAGGKFVFTDNPSNLPPGCQAEYLGDMPDSNVIPSPLSPPVKKIGSQPLTQIVGEELPENDVDEYDVLKREAEALVAKFIEARKRIYRSTRLRTKNNARRDLKEIHSQKGPILSRVDKSTLNRSQKNTIRDILAKATDK